MPDGLCAMNILPMTNDRSLYGQPDIIFYAIIVDWGNGARSKPQALGSRVVERRLQIRVSALTGEATRI